jgi:hypothetical protein
MGIKNKIKLAETSHLRFPTGQLLVIVASYLAIQNHNNTLPSAPLKEAHCFRDLLANPSIDTFLLGVGWSYFTLYRTVVCETDLRT